jgi:hypothetical protein
VSEPQQPEIARSRRSAASESAAKAKATKAAVSSKGDARGPIPADNLPGHHPEVEQDKPTGPPPRKPRAKKPAATKPAAATAAPPVRRRFGMQRDEPLSTVSRLFGVTEKTGYVEVGDELEIRFGPWHLTTPLSNVEKAEVTGPFHWWKVIGPAHLSLADRGVTFATSRRNAVCIRFREPVKAIDPRGLIRHPGATVTVDDPESLAALLNERSAPAA